MRGILHREDFGWSTAPRFGGGGGGGTTQTIQKADPWVGQQPYLTGNDNNTWAPTQTGDATSHRDPGIFGAAAALYTDTNAWPGYYPSSTYVPMNGNQNAIANEMVNYGASGGTLGNANNALAGLAAPGATSQTQGAFGNGQGFLSSALSPGFSQGAGNTFANSNSLLSSELNPGYLNPWNSGSFQTVVNNTLANVLPATSASFVNGNRSDSGLAQRAQTMAATDAVGGLAQNQYNANQQIQQNAAQQAASNYNAMLTQQQQAAATASQDYLAQQGNQLKASAVIPGVDAQQMADMTAGLNAAGLSQQDQQNLLNADIQKWNYNQNLPWNMLGNYAGMVNGTYGGTTTTTQPYYSNQAANIMGGITGGLGLANAGSQAMGFSGLMPMIASMF